jgi:ubiquinone/menaquinone biosynthesis C-methylase UbiE
MAQPTYIHGTGSEEQERLALLNRLTNQSFLEFLDLTDPRSILEIGSGLGILAAEVATHHPKTDVWGIESATQQLESAKKQLRSNLHFVQADAHHPPFGIAQFDVVYCRYILEHVADPVRVLNEAHRVLKPGGKLHVQENNILVLELYPDCPRFAHVWQQFVTLQAQLGGDGEIGKKLFSLLKAAGFQHIELSIAPEIHWAGMPTFRPWVENLIGNVRSGAESLRQKRLATAEGITTALEELRAFSGRTDASMYFYWNRAAGMKAE